MEMGRRSKMIREKEAGGMLRMPYEGNEIARAWKP